jgi:hypothetical protein
MNVNRTIKALTMTVLLLFCTTALAWEGRNEIKVMTQNQYLGADLTPLLVTKDPTKFNEALILILQKVAANRFHDRAQRLAAQIAKERPHVVALQEVWRLGCQEDLPLAAPDQGCNDPTIKGAFVDQLQETLSALKAKA